MRGPVRREQHANPRADRVEGQYHLGMCAPEARALVVMIHSWRVRELTRVRVPRANHQPCVVRDVRLSMEQQKLHRSIVLPLLQQAHT